jgi:hypothetical protein
MESQDGEYGAFLFDKIVIGSPILPVKDHSFGTNVVPLGTVLPNLRLFPNLPSIIKSPS